VEKSKAAKRAVCKKTDPSFQRWGYRGEIKLYLKRAFGLQTEFKSERQTEILAKKIGIV
jgi:hypothetical protein